MTGNQASQPGYISAAVLSLSARFGWCESSKPDSGLSAAGNESGYSYTLLKKWQSLRTLSASPAAAIAASHVILPLKTQTWKPLHTGATHAADSRRLEAGSTFGATSLRDGITHIVTGQPSRAMRAAVPCTNSPARGKPPRRQQGRALDALP